MNNNPYKLSFTKLNETFRTGFVSPAQSTSVTPITPMTPLTTPRTPAQILLGRNEQLQREQRSKRASAIELYEEEKQQQLALEMFTSFVDSVEGSLMDITERECVGENVIGPGILRMCRDLAERVDELAEELKQNGCGDVYDLRLSEHDEDGTEVVHEALAREDSVYQAGSTPNSLLTDIAASLRSISQGEAQELAEVSLQVALMAVWTLRVVQRNMSRMLNSSEAGVSQLSSRSLEKHHSRQNGCGKTRVTWSTDDDTTIISDNRSSGHNSQKLGPLVEIIGEEEKKDENHGVMNINRTGFAHTPQDGSSNSLKDFAKYTPQLATIPSSPSRVAPRSHTNSTVSPRCRALWPPILPTIQKAAQSCINSAQEHPFPASAIGLVCGPATLTTAVIMGPPILITDWVIQSTYNALSQTPFIETLEKAAANALQVSRLAILCSKFAIKQGMAVGERQIQRRGGIDHICCDIVDEAVERVMHPIETVGMALNGIFWMGGMVKDAVGFVSDIVSSEREKLGIH